MSRKQAITKINTFIHGVLNEGAMSKTKQGKRKRSVGILDRVVRKGLSNI